MTHSVHVPIVRVAWMTSAESCQMASNRTELFHVKPNLFSTYSQGLTKDVHAYLLSVLPSILYIK